MNAEGLEDRIRAGEDRIASLENAVERIAKVLMELIESIRDEALKSPPL
jgi:hypothetical protein